MSTEPPPPPHRKRLRRPVPERTQPKRGVLGAFGHRDWRTEQGAQGHPLTPGFEDETSGAAGFAGLDLSDQDVKDASDLIDRHIRQGQENGRGIDTGLFDKLTSLYGDGQGPDLTDLIATITRSYSEIASLWVEMAGSLRDLLQSRAAGENSAAPQASNDGTPGPVLCIQSGQKVEASIDMFRHATDLQVQPLTSEIPGDTNVISDVSVKNGQINLVIPSDLASGTYHGLVLDRNAGPAGVVTVRIPESSGGDP